MTGYLLRMMRREEQRTFESECTVTREGDGEGSYQDGNWIPPEPVPAYEGPCRVRPSLEASREFEQAGQKLHLHLYDIRVPHDADVELSDVFTVTASRDSRLVGMHAVIREIVRDDWTVTRRLICELPEET